MQNYSHITTEKEKGGEAPLPRTESEIGKIVRNGGARQRGLINANWNSLSRPFHRIIHRFTIHHSLEESSISNFFRSNISFAGGNSQGIIKILLLYLVRSPIFLLFSMFLLLKSLMKVIKFTTFFVEIGNSIDNIIGRKVSSSDLNSISLVFFRRIIIINKTSTSFKIMMTLFILTLIYSVLSLFPRY